MTDPLHYPKLRWPIDVRMDQSQDQPVLVIQCPLGISPQPLILKSAVAPLLAHFEGQLSIDQIAQKFSGHGVQRELIQQLAKLLDEHLFLASPRYFSAEQAIREDFSSSSQRAAALAGLSYSADPLALGNEIDSYLGTPSQSEPNSPGPHTVDNLMGLIAPHIDYQRGGACYGAGYRHLRGAPHDLFIVIGTSHQYSKNVFHLTRKDFLTPLGIVPNATNFSDRLANRYGISRSFEDEFLHRREHSLELQLPFIQRTVQSKAVFCPILVGSFHRYVADQRLPNEYDEYESFAGALFESIASEISEGRRVCIIAGVDMAHIGSQFGDSREIDAEWLEAVAGRDRQYLNAIAAQDKRRIFEHICEDQDQRRICGFPTLYTAIDVLDRLGKHYDYEEFGYHQAVHKQAGCVVTFSSAGLYQP